MRTLMLRNFQSPGDLVMLSAAVRDLHRAHPGEFLTDVRTSCPAIWEHNPYLTPLDDHYTTKWWDPARYQQVVEHFRGRLDLVQVGESHHHHPPIEGAIDLRAARRHRPAPSDSAHVPPVTGVTL